MVRGQELIVTEKRGGKKGKAQEKDVPGSERTTIKNKVKRMTDCGGGIYFRGNVKWSGACKFVTMAFALHLRLQGDELFLFN